MKKTNNQSAVRSNQLSGNERIINRTNERKRKIRRKKIIFRSVLGLVFLTAGIILALTMFFNINEITVTGDAVYSPDSVIAASEVLTGDNLIFLSKSKINEKIITKLPYAGSVTVKRRLPSRLELEVHKTEASYAIAENGFYTLLDGNAKVLEKNIEYIGDNIILLNAGDIVSAEPGHILVPANDKCIEKLAAVKKALQECGLNDITVIDLSDIFDIKLTYQGRIVLELGEASSNTLFKKLDFGKSAIEIQDKESTLYRGKINLKVDGTAYWSEEALTTEPEYNTSPPEESATESPPEEKNTADLPPLNDNTA